MNEVPDDEEIADEPGLFQNIDFVVEPLDQLGVRSRALAKAIVQSLVAKLAQIHFARLAFRRRILWILRNAKLQGEIAAIRDHERVRDGLGMIRKQRPHLIGRFEIKLRRVTHPPFVVHHFPGADADHHVVRLVMAPLQEMHVVRRHEAEPELLREFWQDRVALFLHLDAVVVHLEEEIFRAQDIAKIGCALPGLGEVIGLDRHVDLALEAAAQPDQSARMFREQLLIDPRLVMKTIEMRDRDHLHEVAVAGLVPRQQGEMIGGIALVRRAIFHLARGHVGLATDDRFEPGFRRFLVKLDCAVEIPVVGDRDCRHPEFLRFFHQLLRPH